MGSSISELDKQIEDLTNQVESLHQEVVALKTRYFYSIVIAQLHEHIVKCNLANLKIVPVCKFEKQKEEKFHELGERVNRWVSSQSG